MLVSGLLIVLLLTLLPADSLVYVHACYMCLLAVRDLLHFTLLVPAQKSAGKATWISPRFQVLISAPSR